MKNHVYKYFSKTSLKWLAIPGRVYVVSLPIASEVPALLNNILIAHYSIGNWPIEKTWTVAHEGTSAIIARGRTRAEAKANAQAVLLKQGNERFLMAIESMRESIKSIKFAALCGLNE